FAFNGKPCNNWWGSWMAYGGPVANQPANGLRPTCGQAGCKERMANLHFLERQQMLNQHIESALQSSSVISTSRLTKAFGKLVAVNDLHLEVMRGDVFGFLGPNGSGKTTTIRMLLGLIRPTAGRVVIFGMDN